MTQLKNKIENIFPISMDEVPVEFRVTPLEQNYYLGGNGIMQHIKYGKYQKVFSPISVGGKPVYLGKFPMMNNAQVAAIIAAQAQAWDNGNGVWPMMSHRERNTCIRNFIEEMKKTRTQVVNFIMWETCKTLKDSRTEFDRTIGYLTDTCDKFDELIEKWETEEKNGKLTMTVGYNGAGRVLSAGPSNYPVNETLQILIPLLLTGNVIVLKPAKSGVLLFEPLLQCFAKTLPDGVVMTIYGDGKKVITPMVASGKLEFFAFIGGTGTADTISRKIKNPHQVGSFKGLAAKNPFFALEGANIDLAVKTIVDSAIGNNKGERCTAGKKPLIAKKIAAEFIRKSVEIVDNMKIGMPWEDGVQMGPLLPGSVAWMTQLVNDAVAKGASIANECGGMINGGYMHPVVLVDVTEDMMIAKYEQFCPIMPIFTFDGEKGLSDALNWIKKAGYGQQISIMASESKDKATVDYIAQQTKNQCCQLNINVGGKRYDNYPFSGRGLSGQGSISLIEAIMLATFPHVKVVDESYYQ